MMAPRWLLCLLALLFIVSVSGAHFNVTDDTYFDIKWPGIGGPEATGAKEKVEEDPLATQMLVRTPGGGTSYHCTLPGQVHNQKYRKPFADYSGPGPLELLQPLFEQKSCSYKIESYWTYELCHGKHLRQYHEEIEADKSTKKLEFFLGFYKGPFPVPVPAPPTDQKEGQEVKDVPKVLPPPTITLENTNFPYFQVNFTDGTICDVTKRPRQVALFYICLESGRGEIYELVEVESCTYRIVVMSKLLCQHPAYVVSRPHVNGIQCRPADAFSPPKPHSLVAQERLQSATIERGRSSSLEGLFGSDMKIEATRDKDRVLVRIARKDTPQTEQPTAAPAKEPAQPPAQAPAEPPPGLLQKFLSGKDCVIGGSGWWRHELCFGRSVVQFHDDPQSGKRTTLVLGKWNEAAHLTWMANNPNSRPKKNDRLSHFYGGGDRCDETKSSRMVEVRLRCLRNPGASRSAMSIMLQEPSICHYILTVEGVALCSLVNQADENGLLPKDLKFD